MRQATLNPELQNFVKSQAARQYPGVDCEAPMLIALPAGIGPYNRNPGYYDAASNCIVAYQDWGRQLLAEGAQADFLESFIQHELAHWFQCHVLNYAKASTVNAHRDATWAEACYQATNNLWPEYKLDRAQFSCWTSKRIDGKPTRIQREGSLTDVELHHWPVSLPAALDRIKAEAA